MCVHWIYEWAGEERSDDTGARSYQSHVRERIRNSRGTENVGGDNADDGGNKLFRFAAGETSALADNESGYLCTDGGETATRRIEPRWGGRRSIQSGNRSDSYICTELHARRAESKPHSSPKSSINLHIYRKAHRPSWAPRASGHSFAIREIRRNENEGLKPGRIRYTGQTRALPDR